jgi:hypothetical protein
MKSEKKQQKEAIYQVIKVLFDKANEKPKEEPKQAFMKVVYVADKFNLN